jgi:hypothetical protein
MNTLSAQRYTNNLNFLYYYKKLSKIKIIKRKYSSYFIKLFLLQSLKNLKGKDESIAL